MDNALEAKCTVQCAGVSIMLHIVFGHTHKQREKETNSSTCTQTQVRYILKEKLITNNRVIMSL